MSKKNNQGLVEIILLVIVVIIILSVLGVDLRKVVDSEIFQKNYNFVKEFVIGIWVDYIKPATSYLWSKVFRPFLWEPIRGLIIDRAATST